MIRDPLDVGPSLEQNPRRVNLRLEAEAWIAANPVGYAHFVEFAHQMASVGKVFGIGLLAERVRWEGLFKSTGDFKVNNNHRAYVARRLVQDYPALEPFMQFRRTRY